MTARSDTLLPALPAPLLYPLSLLYGGAATLHRGLYSTGVLKRRRLPRPVLSMGNLAAGGGGKTPMTIWLASRLAERGMKVAVLSRGYGRSDPSATLVVSRGEGPLLPPGEAGDEPYLMADNLPGVRVIVSPSRHRAGLLALEEGEVDVFLLDDGFQHHSLHRDLDVVLLDDRRRLGNGRLLPAGILRESPRRLADAHLLVVSKAGEVDPAFERELNGRSAAPVCWTGYRPGHLRPAGGGEPLPTDALEGMKVAAVSAIADHVSFEETLAGLPVDCVQSLPYPDHHRFTRQEVEGIGQRARAKGAGALVITEKDLVRWPAREGDMPCFALCVEPFFLRGEGVFMETVLDRLEERLV